MSATTHTTAPQPMTQSEFDEFCARWAAASPETRRLISVHLASTEQPAAASEPFAQCPTCSDSFPARSYGAGFLDAAGQCENCAAGMPMTAAASGAPSDGAIYQAVSERENPEARQQIRHIVGEMLRAEPVAAHACTASRVADHGSAASGAAPQPEMIGLDVKDKRRELLECAIDGALTSGYQGVAPAPEGHWLDRWWQQGRRVREREEALERDMHRIDFRALELALSVMGVAAEPPHILAATPGRWVQTLVGAVIRTRDEMRAARKEGAAAPAAAPAGYLLRWLDSIDSAQWYPCERSARDAQQHAAGRTEIVAVCTAAPAAALVAPCCPPGWTAERLDEFTVRVTPPSGTAWRICWADERAGLDHMLWRLGCDMAAAPAAAPVIPEGWQLVPIEPVPEMLTAAQRRIGQWTTHWYSEMWRACLDAAPKPPALAPAAAQPAQQDALDAARYRFLRHADLDAMAAAHWPSGTVPEGEAFDAAVDAEMQAGAAPGTGTGEAA